MTKNHCQFHFIPRLVDTQPSHTNDLIFLCFASAKDVVFVVAKCSQAWPFKLYRSHTSWQNACFSVLLGMYVCEEAHRSHFVGGRTPSVINRLFGSTRFHIVAAKAGLQPPRLSYVGFTATPDAYSSKGGQQFSAYSVVCCINVYIEPIHKRSSSPDL